MDNFSNTENRAKVFTTLIKLDNYTFTYSTYLKFGDSNNIIGGCILPNQRNIKLINEEE